MHRSITRELFLFALFILIYGCGDVGGAGQCGGASATGICIFVTDVTPVYMGKTTNRVDVQETTCVDIATGAITSSELKLEAHDVNITFANMPLLNTNSTAGLPVAVFKNYSITYNLVSCPANATCPTIDKQVFSPGETITIQTDKPTTETFPLVSLSSKSEYTNANTTLTSFPTYTATYLFNGTTLNNEALSVTATQTFSIGEYVNCT